MEICFQVFYIIYILIWFIGDLKFKPASGGTEIFEMNRAPCHQRQPTQDLHSSAKSMPISADILLKQATSYTRVINFKQEH